MKVKAYAIYNIGIFALQAAYSFVTETVRLCYIFNSRIRPKPEQRIGPNPVII